MKKLVVDKQRAADDPVYFIEKFTDLKLSEGQKLILRALAKYHRVIVKAGRRFGKTVLDDAAAAWFMYTKPNTKVGYFAPSWDQCEIFMEEMYNKVLGGSILEESFVDPKKFSLEISNKSKLIAKTANISSQSGRGHGFDLIIPDESAFIPDEVMAAIRPTRLVGAAWELQTSNPCGHGHFYRDFNSKIFKSFSFKTIENPLVDKKELKKEKEVMTDIEFKQEYEAEFIEDEFSVFPNKIIDAARSLGIERNVEFLSRGKEEHFYYGGLDLGRKQDKSVINVVDHVHPFVDLVYRKEITNDHTDAYWTKVMDEVEKVTKAFRMKVWCVDQTAIGDMPTLTLKQNFRENNIPTIVNGIVFSSAIKNSRDGLVNSLLLQFERNYLALPHYPELIKQLKNVRRKVVLRPTKDVISTYSLRGLDHVTSLALAVRAVPFYSPSFFHVKANTRVSSLESTERKVMRVY